MPIEGPTGICAFLIMISFDLRYPWQNEVREVILRFLLSGTRKFSPKVWNLDLVPIGLLTEKSLSYLNPITVYGMNPCSVHCNINYVYTEIVWLLVLPFSPDFAFPWFFSRFIFYFLIICMIIFVVFNVNSLRERKKQICTVHRKGKSGMVSRAQKLTPWWLDTFGALYM